MAMEEPQTNPQAPENNEQPPAIPDYCVSPNAVFADKDVQWRYGRAPDYSKTRKVWAEGKTMNHAPGSLEEIVENLVKNWEVEASFKPRLSDWRTIDHENYSFAMGGGPPQTAEQMIKVGTYNAIIAPNEYYSPENSDFASSHKTFKRMMPTFAWEVLEVYSGPPRVSFRWRHWGMMKNDYVGFNDKGQKVTAKAHGGIIDIEGVTVAEVDEKLRLRAIQTWMDPLEMFRQVAPNGIVNKQTMNRNVDKEAALDVNAENGTTATNGSVSANGTVATEKATTPPDTSQQGGRHGHHDAGDAYMGMKTDSGVTTAQTPSRPLTVGITRPSTTDSEDEAQWLVNSAAAQGDARRIEKPASNAPETTEAIAPSVCPHPRTTPKSTSAASTSESTVPRSSYSSGVNGREEDMVGAAQRAQVQDESQATGAYDDVDRHLERAAEEVHPHLREVEKRVLPAAGEAVAVDAESEETRMTREEMSGMLAGECPFLMNRE